MQPIHALLVPPRHRLASLLGIGIGALAFAPFAMAATWTYALEPTGTEPLLHGASLQPLADGGFITAGTDSFQQYWRLRLDAQFAPIEHQQRSRTGFVGATPVTGTAPPLLTYLSRVSDVGDGSTLEQGCALERDTVGLDQRAFRQTITPYANPQSLPTRVGFDSGHGHLGVYGYRAADGSHRQRAARFARDCSRLDLYEAASITAVAATPLAFGGYVLGGERDSERLHRVDAGGALWDYAPAASAGVSLLPVTIAGDALLLRRLADGNTTLESITLDGLKRWEFALPTGRVLIDVYEGRDARTLVLHRPSNAALGPPGVHAIDRDGRVAWQATFDAAPFQRALAAQDERDPVWWLGSPSSEAGSILVRAGENGLQTLARLPTGITATSAIDAARFAVIDGGDAANARLQIRHYDSDAVIPVELRVPRTRVAAGLAADGHGAVLVDDDGSGAATLHHLEPDGRLRWQASMPAAAGVPPPGSVELRQRFDLALDATRVCAWRRHGWADHSRLACYRRNDGSVLFDDVAMPGQRGDAESAMWIDENGDLLVAYRNCTVGDGTNSCVRQAGLQRIDARGELTGATVFAEFSANRSELQLASSPRGRRFATLLLQDGSPPQVQVHDADGTLRWRIELDTGARLLAIDDEGRVLLRVGVRYDAPSTIVLLDEDGRAAWRSPLPDATRESASSTYGILLPDGSAIVSAPIFNTVPSNYLARFGGADGATIWQRSDTTPQSLHGFVQGLSPDLGVVLARTRAGARFDARLIAVRADDGDTVGAQTLYRVAPHTGGDPLTDGHAAAVAADGALWRAQAHHDSGQLSLTRSAPAALLGGEGRIDASLLGFWMSENTTGQGLFLDLEAGADIAYGAWFTYSGSGGHAPSTQRWYTFTSDTIDGDHAALSIQRSRGGRFAQPPAVGSEVVGSAILRRLDCDHALLSYRFDAGTENGRAGDIPLVRAAPASRDCAAPHPPRVAMAEGLDPRSSGAWYAPSSSGQGLLFELVPPSESTGGYFSGAWFTFDADGHADDPDAQHWFTLAGSLRYAEGGVLGVPIFRTQGGALDAGPTNNTHAVGVATLRFHACDRASLDYAFDDSDVAQHHAGSRGSIELQRIGGCGD